MIIVHHILVMVIVYGNRVMYSVAHEIFHNDALALMLKFSCVFT